MKGQNLSPKRQFEISSKSSYIVIFLELYNKMLFECSKGLNLKFHTHRIRNYL